MNNSRKQSHTPPVGWSLLLHRQRYTVLSLTYFYIYCPWTRKELERHLPEQMISKKPQRMTWFHAPYALGTKSGAAQTVEVQCSAFFIKRALNIQIDFCQTNGFMTSQAFLSSPKHASGCVSQQIVVLCHRKN